MKAHRLPLLVSALMLIAFPAWGQRRVGTQGATPAKPLPPSVSISKDTGFLSCWGQNESQPVSKLIRSPVLASGDGRHRAYVEVEALAFAPEHPDDYGGPSCANQSRLFLAAKTDKAFRVVYMETAERSELGNSLKLVDWSPDGKHLLLERTKWQYESEGGYTDFLLFSPDFGVVTKADLYALIAGKFGSECGTENSILGFTEQGAVVVAIGPMMDDFGDAASCVKEVTLLSVDLEHGLRDSIQLLDNVKVRRYGRPE